MYNSPFINHSNKRKGFFARMGISSTAVAIVALVLVACGGVVGSGIAGGPTGSELIQHETNVDNNALGRIEKNEPIPVLSDSSDAHNQRQFVIEESDPNKIEYLELLGLNGNPIAHFTIKGQVSAMDTSETNPSQIDCPYEDNNNNSASLGCGSIGLAEPNGIYGGADAGHFAFTTSGALIEWEGNFITSDQPFNIKTPVQLVLNESVAPTPTSHSNIVANG
jgi:hypothetical protein